MKRLAILGCTGSIGRQTLDIVRRYPDKFKVEALVANTDVANLLLLAEEFKPSFIGICTDGLGKLIKPSYSCEICEGSKVLEYAASMPKVDCVVCAVVGIAGLSGVISAIINKKQIALANKESLVCAGELIMKLAKENNVDILPVDSEHSAVWQAIKAGRDEDVAKIILTASGGPFRGFTNKEQFNDVTVEKAIAHPNWSMGKKISVDSASMMNKGLEIIEAHWLFNKKEIDYVIHPQSIIHSMVEYKDGSIIAQMSNPNMELPIQLALTYPERFESATPKFCFDKSLTFSKPNEDLFFLPKLAKDSINQGKNASCILNSANEKAVELFLSRKIGFYEMMMLVEKIYLSYSYEPINSINDVIFVYNDVVRKTELDYKKLLEK